MNKKLLLLVLTILTTTIACQRNNMTYGGVKADTDSPKYTHEININAQNTGK